MDDDLESRIEAISISVVEIKLKIEKILEAETPDSKESDEANDAVVSISARYRDLVEGLSPSVEMKVDRTLGRRVTDLRRMAAALPQKTFSEPVALAADAGEGGEWRVLMEPGVPSPPPPQNPNRRSPERAAVERAERGPGVGDDIESWCGPCDDMREHTIVAMVGGEAKSVICRACGARHNYRTTPARCRKSGDDAPATPLGKRKLTKDQARERRVAKEKQALQKELAEATDIRPYNRLARYKAGEIIEHPEFGRGKIESIIRGSLLVRFNDRLRSLY